MDQNWKAASLRNCLPMSVCAYIFTYIMEKPETPYDVFRLRRPLKESEAVARPPYPAPIRVLIVCNRNASHGLQQLTMSDDDL